MYVPVVPRPPAALAISSLVLGLVGVLLSFLPIVNNVTAAGALVGVVLGFVGIWRSRQVMSAFGVVLCGAAVALTLVAQTTFGDRLDELFADPADSGIPSFGFTTAEIPAPAGKAATTYRPAPADFHLAAKILEKRCLDTAGCDVTYQVAVTYTGQPLSPNETFTVVYEVRGVADGPSINNFTVTGTQVRVRAEEFARTTSADAALLVVATETF
jgi:hypothetical protein